MAAARCMRGLRSARCTAGAAWTGEQAYVCGFVGAWCEWIRPPKACGGNKCGKEK
jgi:hypothetical protein